MRIIKKRDTRQKRGVREDQIMDERKGVDNIYLCSEENLRRRCHPSLGLTLMPIAPTCRVTARQYAAPKVP